MRIRGRWVGAVVGGVGCAGAWAQTHVVKKPETVVRAVAVYEWTGDEGKATGSRVVPVSVFINGQLEDAGVYLARPVPFALDAGTVFEVEKAGAPEGSVELAYARHYLSNGGPAIDDGWLAYGALKLKPAERVTAAKKSGPLPQVVASGGSGPHFSNKPASGADAGKTEGTDAGKADAKKPVDRSGAAGAGTTVSADDDPNRPTMRRRDTSGDADTNSTDGTTTAKTRTDSDSAKDDPDRPTLKKRTSSPAETKAAQKRKDLASVTGSGTLNDDPDRPVLHRGAPADVTDEAHLPPLHGLPKDMHQMVAVSDAANRPEHEFARGWESDAEQAEVTAKLEEMARAKLGGYDVAAAAPGRRSRPGGGGSGAAKAAPAKTGTAKAGAASRARRSAAPAAAASPVPVALVDESVRGYTLSYGGAATYVYSASSPGVGGAVRYATVVAQREPLGELKVALASVTDSKHLDRTPWMRLVDAVDAEASNRASLLFELRGETSRQFGLYRVIGAAAEQTFLTAVPE